jgi:phosphatidylserine/phosphatidylglycerophosphate/cardiolipin synthase-like enzyme
MKTLIAALLSILSLISIGYADSVRIIDSGEEAYQVRMNLIESAKEEIQISYFIFAEDTTAMEVLALLRKKAREGVQVKIMIDEMFNKIPADVGAHLMKENVIIKNFNKFNFLRFGKSIRYRMHDKMFIVDHQKIILGGRNIEDTYFDRAKKNYDDRDIYVAGHLAREAGQYFNELWNADHLTNFEIKKLKVDKGAETLDLAESNYMLKAADAGFNMTSWENDLVEVEKVELLHDQIAKKKTKMTGTAAKLYDLIRNAKKSVYIDSPYLVMTKELKALLKEVIAKGIKVRILTNSLHSTDALFPQAAYIGQRKKMVRMGIELYEYNAEESFHAKSMVVDEEIAAIGSFNFDPRSQNLNTETMAVVFDKKVATLLTQSMDENVSQAYKIDQDGKPEGQTSRLPGATLKKKILTRLIQYLVVPFTRGLL